MSAGRCAGCQETGEVKAVRWHVISCLDWAALYQHDPLAALSPEEEQARWLREDKDGEKLAHREATVADTDARRAAMASRFRTRDPLEDE